MQHAQKNRHDFRHHLHAVFNGHDGAQVLHDLDFALGHLGMEFERLEHLPPGHVVLVGGFEFLVDVGGHQARFHQQTARLFVAHVLPQRLQFLHALRSVVCVDALGKLLDAQPDYIPGSAVGQDAPVFLDVVIRRG